MKQKKPKSHLVLTAEQQTYLTALLRRGTIAVKTYRRATALLALDGGQSYSAVAQQLGVRYTTVSGWAQQFATGGFAFLTDKPRSGRPVVIDGLQRAKVTALACSPAPDGRSQWSLRLLASKAVELGYCQQLSAASAHDILKKTTSSPSANASGALAR